MNLRKIIEKVYLLLEFIFKKYYSYFPSKKINEDLKIVYNSGRKIDDETYNIIFLIDYCWNIVDAYLPVLYWLNKNFDNVRIIAIIYVDNAGKKREEEEFLYKYLKEYSDIIILNDYLDNKINNTTIKILKIIEDISDRAKKRQQLLLSLDEILNNNFMFKKVDVVLKDNGADDDIKKYINFKYSKAKCFTHPHTGFLAMTKNTIKQIACYADFHTQIDCFYEYDYKGIEDRIVVIGTPRYDRWWIEHIIKQEDFLNSQENRKAKNFKKTIVLFLGELFDDKRMLPEEFERFINSINSIFMKNKECFLIIKLHPKNNSNQIEDLLLNIDKEQWMVSNFQCMQLAYIADLVICPGISTSIMDALVLGKTTIEYSEGNIKDFRYLCDDGKYGSFVRYHKLAICVDNKEYLEKIVHEILCKSINFSVYVNRLTNILRLNNNSSEAFGKLIIDNVNKSS